jgi:beta-lactamase regulating signal transducer with metallopeptidase domain
MTNPMPIGSPLWAAAGWTMAHYKRQSRMIESGEIPLLCHRLARALQIGRRAAVGVCDHLATPVLIGILRPVILLPPAALNGWTIEQLEMVLCHKLAHLRRWDNLINLIQRVVESLRLRFLRRKSE